MCVQVTLLYKRTNYTYMCTVVYILCVQMTLSILLYVCPGDPIYPTLRVSRWPYFISVQTVPICVQLYIFCVYDWSYLFYFMFVQVALLYMHTNYIYMYIFCVYDGPYLSYFMCVQVTILYMCTNYTYIVQLYIICVYNWPCLSYFVCVQVTLLYKRTIYTYFVYNCI